MMKKNLNKTYQNKTHKVKKDNKNEPLIPRFWKEVKRIRWTSTAEAKKNFKWILIWTIALSLMFYLIDLIVHAILG